MRMPHCAAPFANCAVSTMQNDNNVLKDILTVRK